MKTLLLIAMTAFVLPSGQALAKQAGADSTRQAEARSLVLGSKKDTESVILGELLAGLAQARDLQASHRRELGGTRVLWNALLTGDIDAYVEYSGTLLSELFAGEGLTLSTITDTLRALGIEMSSPLGFNNTYVLGMRASHADRLGITNISQLALHPSLRLAFTNEFMDRADGWPHIRRLYALPHDKVRGLDHDLAYRGIAAGDIDVIDLYSTDAEIKYYDLRRLEDDRRAFPEYQALILYRTDIVPGFVDAISMLEGAISADSMAALNARVRLEGVSESRAAVDYLRGMGISATLTEASRTERILRTTKEHLSLVGISLLAAILLAIPLGIWAANYHIAGRIILGIVGMIYTIPALALLVFMIPLLGIGAAPAMVALFLYSLLPIVRNTHAGLMDIPVPLRESADALGLSAWTRLVRIELPLASRSILAGIKTAAVINIGTATLGALIGAGGYGQPILTGIRLDNVELILEGALPAALLALLAQGIFDMAERSLIPRGLRIKPTD